jgi:hypothetical protein
MKKWVPILGIGLLLFLAGYFVLSFYAVKFINAELKESLGPGMAIGDVKVRVTYLAVKGVQYEDPKLKRKMFQIEEMRIYPSLFSALLGTLRIREWTMLRPVFTLYRSPDGVWVGPWILLERMGKKREEKRDKTPDKKEKEDRPFQIKMDRLRIRDGRVDIEDRKVSGPPALIQLREVNFDLEKIEFPLTSARSPLDFEGKLKGPKKDGVIASKGWINLKTTDMGTSLNLRETELKIFEPYYRKNVTAEIESGYVNMEAKITIKESMIDAPGELDLVDLRMKEDGTFFYIPAKTMVSLLNNKKNQIHVRFHVKGKMDDPQFNLREDFLTRVALSIAETLGLPIKVVGGEVLGGTVKGAKGLVDAVRSVEELFRPKKEKK